MAASPPARQSVQHFGMEEMPMEWTGTPRNVGWCKEMLKQRLVNCLVPSFQCISRKIPALHWLPKYRWKKYFVNDFMSGFTVAVMHVPQGLAFAQLGEVTPIIGIYMAIFPNFIYFLFGTSRHMALGTSAVVCMLSGQIVHKVTTLQSDNDTMSCDKSDPIEVGSALTCLVAIYMLLMYCCGLGTVASFLSKTYISGFTTGASVHVLTSQVSELLGLRSKRRRGPLKVIYTYIDIVSNITQANTTAVLMSACTVAILTLDSLYVKPRVMKALGILFPLELVVIILATVISNVFHFQEQFNLSVIGCIPSGMPSPKPPRLCLLQLMAADAFLVAVITYCISLAMALVFADRMNYHVDANQELLAQGLTNLFASFFLCLPESNSISRSTVQIASGGQTQLVAVVSSFILLSVLFYFGPLLEALPRCVLASIIFVALYKMWTQFMELLEIWKVSKVDACVWVGTFLCVVGIDIDRGVPLGMLIMLLVNFVQCVHPHVCLMGVTHTLPGRFVEHDPDISSEIVGMKVIQLTGHLTFASKESFRRKVYALSGVNPHHVTALVRTYDSDGRADEYLNTLKKTDFEMGRSSTGAVIVVTDSLRSVVIDLKLCSRHDVTGMQALASIASAYKNIGVHVDVITASSS